MSFRDPRSLTTFEDFGGNALTLVLRCYLDSLEYLARGYQPTASKHPRDVSRRRHRHHWRGPERRDKEGARVGVLLGSLIIIRLPPWKSYGKGDG